MNKEEFKDIMQRGTWRERYEAVKFKNITKNGLDKDSHCRNLLRECAKYDKARLVRFEAIGTCHALEIKEKGKDILRYDLPSLRFVVNMKKKTFEQLIFNAIMKSGVEPFPQKRTLTNGDLQKICEAFKAENPSLYDKIDGLTAENERQMVNYGLVSVIRKYFPQIQESKIKTYRRNHPEIKKENATITTSDEGSVVNE